MRLKQNLKVILVDMPGLYDSKENENKDLPKSIEFLNKLETYIKKEFNGYISFLLWCIKSDDRWSPFNENVLKVF